MKDQLGMLKVLKFERDMYYRSAKDLFDENDQLKIENEQLTEELNRLKQDKRYKKQLPSCAKEGKTIDTVNDMEMSESAG